MIRNGFLGVLNNAMLKIRVIYRVSDWSKYQWEQAHFDSNIISIEMSLEIYLKDYYFLNATYLKIDGKF